MTKGQTIADANSADNGAKANASGNTQIRNFTSPEGHEVGKQMAAWCDDATPLSTIITETLK